MGRPYETKFASRREAEGYLGEDGEIAPRVLEQVFDSAARLTPEWQKVPRDPGTRVRLKDGLWWVRFVKPG